jgi:hypothetical protein
MACFNHKVNHMRRVYCVAIKTCYILIRVSTLYGGLPWLQHGFILTIRHVRLFRLAFLIRHFVLALDRQYNHSNLMSE